MYVTLTSSMCDTVQRYRIRNTHIKQYLLATSKKNLFHSLGNLTNFLIFFFILFILFMRSYWLLFLDSRGLVGYLFPTCACETSQQIQFSLDSCTQGIIRVAITLEFRNIPFINHLFL